MAVVRLPYGYWGWRCETCSLKSAYMTRQQAREAWRQHKRDPMHWLKADPEMRQI